MEQTNKNYYPDSFWRGKPVLVTGGAGFIGSWLSHELVCRGARVTIFDIKKQLSRLGESEDLTLKKAVFIHGDVRDGDLLESIYRSYGIKTVFHLAAKVLVNEALANPAEALDTNIIGTVRILEGIRKLGRNDCQAVVASSDKAYGEHERLPYNEERELKGDNHPYDCSKGCADRIARMYARVYGLNVSVTRCGNVFGGGDLNFSRLIPGAIKAFHHNKDFEIRSDGTFMRDYVYVKDIVAAYILTAENMAGGKFNGEAFNFGNNRPLAAAEVADKIKGLMGKPHLRAVILGTAQNEIKNQYLDAAKATQVLGWAPGYNFEEGLSETVSWYRTFFNDVYSTL